jgi:hypothetical protein
MQLNVTATDTNLDKVWYNYNGTNITVTGATSGVYNLSNITLTTKKNITFYANDTIGNLNSTTISWDYLVFLNNLNYQTTNYETNTSQFLLNVSIGNNFNFIQPYLVYNGNEYIINSYYNEGNNKIFLKNISIPLNTNYIFTAKQFFLF